MFIPQNTLYGYVPLLKTGIERLSDNLHFEITRQ